jgi:aryl-alcohol dehydrogenase-like predicted oxidoreductase
MAEDCGHALEGARRQRRTGDLCHRLRCLGGLDRRFVRRDRSFNRRYEGGCRGRHDLDRHCRDLRDGPVGGIGRSCLGGPSGRPCLHEGLARRARRAHPRSGPRAAEASLQRLGRDAIDLYLLLEADPALAVEDTWESMAALADEGVVRAIGLCNLAAELVGRCERVRHVDAVQNQFSLIHRDEHVALSAHCSRFGTTFISYGPLALGLLAGKRNAADTSWGRGKTSDELSAYQRSLFGPDVIEGHLDYVDRLQAVANRCGLPLAEVALAWVTLLDEFTVAIAGSTSADNTRANARAGGLKLERSVAAELEALAILD